MKRFLVCICFITLAGCVPIVGQDWYVDGKVKARVERYDRGCWVRTRQGESMFVLESQLYRERLKDTE